jgi:hypothetical protein
MLRMRYLRESDRGCQGALRELRRLQAWRLENGAELGMQAPADAPTEKAPETGPGTHSEEAPAGPAETVSRTEAAAPQVAGVSRSCNEDFEGDRSGRTDGPSGTDRTIA